MKKILFLTICFLSFISSQIFAENNISYLHQKNFAYNTNWQYNISLLALSDANTSSETRAVKAKSSGINLHRILGWSTILSAAATIITGAAGAGDDKIHCGLAGLSTVLAAVTCANGFYEYNDTIGFDGDKRYTAHAAAGMFATAGFAASLLLADGKSHAAAGSISGAAFLFTVGIIYF
ncbi:MAG: hypothetical protein V1874_06430 [Spirochaetota bacterium]